MKLLAAGSLIQMMYRRYIFKFLIKFYGISYYFFKILTEVALKRNFLQMKSKEKMMGNVCAGDQF